MKKKASGTKKTSGDAKEGAPPLAVSPIEDWRAFLPQASNATLFHDPAFLAYHPAGRFHPHALEFRRAGQTAPVAVLPAALESEGRRKVLRAPFGASFGGFLFEKNPRTLDAADAADALVRHARARKWSAVEIRTGPPAHQGFAGQLQEAALFAAGFRPARVSVSYVLDLAAAPGADLASTFSKGKRYDARAGRKAGLSTREARREGLESFFRLKRETFQRHESGPTHTDAEIASLMELVPGRVRLFLCGDASGRADADHAAILVFRLTAASAYTFYICNDDRGRELFATAVAVADVAERLRSEGLRWLDLGPSAVFAENPRSSRVNAGAVAFKEGFHAQPQTRVDWIWKAK